MECPNCGYCFDFCVNCGEYCSDDETQNAAIEGRYSEEDGGYICIKCDDKEGENEQG